MKIFYYLLVTLLAVAIAILSAIFYIGSEISYQRLLDDLGLSFIRRFIGFAIIGIFGLSLLAGINFFANIFMTQKLNIKKLFLTGVLIVSLASFFGTIIFFFVRL
ncbi:MAG: hypothetical protein IR153_06220 [Flavobacterium sp.]|nr:hypothetical protein [Flavobacterium sp.]